MPSTTFDMKADLKTKEPNFQKWWLEQQIYQKRLQKNAKLPQFTLHDGPPYANGNIHVGHSLNKTLKDIIVRFKSMNGFYVSYVAGWDTHGLPIENAISKLDKNFEANNDVAAKRQMCREYAKQQVAIQKAQFRRLGMFTDFKDTYLTLDPSFIHDELKLFKIMVEKNLVFQDFKPIYWSWSTRCALADAEIEYADVTSPSIYVSFQLVDEPVKLLIWTTTPWTLPANLAIAVHPELDYCYVSVGQQQFLVAKNLVADIANKLGWKDYKVTKTVKGKILEKKLYYHPWIKRTSPIILADYVSATDGTGLVHNAPAFGLDDFYACKKYGIDAYCPIDDFGKYTKNIEDDELMGMFYLKADEIIIKRLQTAKALEFLGQIVHSVAHDWRTHKPVMYRATKQWFINIGKVSPMICNSLDKDVSALNAKTTERIKEMIFKRQEWCISRQRVWGVPIPMLFDEHHEAIYDIKLIDHIIDVLKRDGVDTWFAKDAKYFVPEWMDRTKTYYKEKDIIDVWFDSGSTYNVLQHHNLKYPADLYLEGTDQFRGWFNSSAINGAIQNGHVPYKFLLQHGFTLDEKGFKMSKSLGNTIDPIKICDEYGADVLRLWVASSEYTSDLKFGINIIKQVAENYRKIRNTLFKFSLSNLNDFDYQKHFTTKLRVEDEYVLKQLKECLASITKYYNVYNFIEVVKNVTNFTNHLSQWYFDVIKDALYCEPADAQVRRQIQSTIFTIVKTLVVVLSPIIPHTCEEVYSCLQFPNKLTSVCLEDWPNLKDFDNALQANLVSLDSFFKMKDDIYAELEKARQNQVIKKNNEAKVCLPAQAHITCEQLQAWLNVAQVEFHKENAIVVTNADYTKCLRCWNHFDKKHMANEEICKRCAKIVLK